MVDPEKKGTTINLLFRNLKLGNVYVKIDFQILYGERRIRLLNPRADIPKLGAKDVDVREHPEWRELLKDPSVQEDIKREMIKYTDVVTITTLPLDMKDLWN